ncbi:radical SAM protein [Streptomyces sp. NBC_01803]|uniref:radical SAM protein n=1 Tax=Streptomyces sp. NBC_01803 TaxID=2975946 RepID=UPI002DDACBF1|nr:radical SAM protein [Streptomyces sp. NBC_01803]WSA47477.1 radical SAM protein [Streptomyces sp. NBC_01803]
MHFMPSALYSRAAALESLAAHDSRFPRSAAAEILRDPANEKLLGYVFSEAFTHVFPGDRAGHPPRDFFAELDEELASTPSYHLWTLVPLCRYRCHFCQFPIMVLSADEERSAEAGRRWVDANIAEARLWLEAVPSLASAPVGEFCLFGGTPTAIAASQIERLMDFYTTNFNFTPQTSLRAEGSPDTLTPDMVARLRGMGFANLTYGIQSFDDRLLELANRRHTGTEAEKALRHAREHGFARVDGDLVYGLPGQDVPSFLSDIHRMIDLGFDTIVAIKLHLRSFGEVTSAIGHVAPTPWESAQVRRRIAESGHRWPSLGEQYQMREAAVSRLHQAGYSEHPTTYFPHDDAGPQHWRSLNLDQERQYPQVGIGLGGYTWSSLSEANVVSDPRRYQEAIAAGRIPLETVTSISPNEREVRAVRMALSTCQPLRDDIHQARFPGSSLFGARWSPALRALADRGLVTVDTAARTVALTPVGMTLVEAIMNAEIR